METSNIQDMEEDFLAIWELCRPYTMVSVERAYALYQSVNYIIQNDIPGDFAECGVWKGGCCMLMAYTLQKAGQQNRQIWLYDTFSGMTEPEDDDRIAYSGEKVHGRWQKQKEGWWKAEQDLVRENLAKTAYPAENFSLIAGDVIQTLEENKPERIALLRLDTDWYASTKAELEQLYPRLQSKGVLLLDDYGHFTGAKKAVDEYFSQQDFKPLLCRSDYTGRLLIKL